MICPKCKYEYQVGAGCSCGYLAKNQVYLYEKSRECLRDILRYRLKAWDASTEAEKILDLEIKTVSESIDQALCAIKEVADVNQLTDGQLINIFEIPNKSCMKDLFEDLGFPVSSPEAWNEVFEEIKTLTEKCDGEETSQQIAKSCFDWICQLKNDGLPAPFSVYPASGSAMVEWRLLDRTMVSAEIRKVGEAEVLVWRPNFPEKFVKVVW